MERTKIFNYSDVFYTCLAPEDVMLEYKLPFHALTYIYSGELNIEDRKSNLTIHPGEYVFIRRDNHVKILKQSLGEDAPYKSITIRLERRFLRSYFNTVDKKDMPVHAKRFNTTAILLPKTPYIESLFLSLFPYKDTEIKSADEIINMKMQEAMFCLLSSNERFYPTLFDFNEEWKIDLLKFMEENYTQDMPLEDFAKYTGRSLATFKRDFAKINDLSPEKWLIRKRLETAYEMIHNDGKKVSEVYMKVGFKNRSHFTTAFKKQYGIPPANVALISD